MTEQYEVHVRCGHATWRELVTAGNVDDAVKAALARCNPYTTAEGAYPASHPYDPSADDEHPGTYALEEWRAWRAEGRDDQYIADRSGAEVWWVTHMLSQSRWIVRPG